MLNGLCYFRLKLLKKLFYSSIKVSKSLAIKTHFIKLAFDTRQLNKINEYRKPFYVYQKT